MAFGFSSGSFEKIADGLYRIRFNQGFVASRFATGLEKLAFEVIYCLFTSEGSIPSNPKFGTKLKDMIGQLSMGADASSLVAIISAEVVKAENQVKSSQATATLPMSERLKSIAVDLIEVNEAEQSVTIHLIIVNALDQAVGFEIPDIGVTV